MKRQDNGQAPKSTWFGFMQNVTDSDSERRYRKDTTPHSTLLLSFFLGWGGVGVEVLVSHQLLIKFSGTTLGTDQCGLEEVNAICLPVELSYPWLAQ